MQVFELAAERIGPVLSPYHPRCTDLRGAPPSAVLDETLLHTALAAAGLAELGTSAGLDPARLRLGQSFEHLYFLLEAALAGLGVAIAPQQLVADDLRQGRLLAPRASSRPAPDWRSAPARRVDRRAERLAEWLRNELERQ